MHLKSGFFKYCYRTARENNLPAWFRRCLLSTNLRMENPAPNEDTGHAFENGAAMI